MNIIPVMLALLAMPSRAGGGYDAENWAVYRVELDLADRIQKQVLDHILGPGQSAAFVALDVEFRAEEESSFRDGVGVVETVQSVAASTGTAQSQKASQRKATWDSRLSVRRAAKKFSVRILYDQKLSPAEIAAAREALRALLQPQSRDADIRFMPVLYWKR